MKIKNILLIITSLLFTLSGVNAEYRIYDNVEDFEAAKGAICEAATDGCNNYFMADGKVGGGTKMFCQDHIVEWTCTKFKENSITTMSIETTSAETTSIDTTDAETTNMVGGDRDEHGCIPSAGYSWSETKEECVRPWEEEELVICTMEYAPVCGVDGKTYSNRCGAEKGAKTEVDYEGECKLKKDLGKNDQSFYDTIKKRLPEKYQKRVNSTVIKYEKKLEKYSSVQKERVNNRIIKLLESNISLLLSKYPQDEALPTNAYHTYMTLKLFTFELMQLNY